MSLSLTLSALSGAVDPWADIPLRYTGVTRHGVFDSAPRRRYISLTDAVRLCGEIRRKDERRRQEILDHEARIAMELDLPG
jgi:hypothetical protein